MLIFSRTTFNRNNLVVHLYIICWLSCSTSHSNPSKVNVLGMLGQGQLCCMNCSFNNTHLLLFSKFLVGYRISAAQHFHIAPKCFNGRQVVTADQTAVVKLFGIILLKLRQAFPQRDVVWMAAYVAPKPLYVVQHSVLLQCHLRALIRYSVLIFSLSLCVQRLI